MLVSSSKSTVDPARLLVMSPCQVPGDAVWQPEEPPPRQHRLLPAGLGGGRRAAPLSLWTQPHDTQAGQVATERNRQTTTSVTNSPFFKRASPFERAF